MNSNRRDLLKRLLVGLAAVSAAPRLLTCGTGRDVADEVQTIGIPPFVPLFETADSTVPAWLRRYITAEIQARPIDRGAQHLAQWEATMIAYADHASSMSQEERFSTLSAAMDLLRIGAEATGILIPGNDTAYGFLYLLRYLAEEARHVHPIREYRRTKGPIFPLEAIDLFGEQYLAEQGGLRWSPIEERACSVLLREPGFVPPSWVMRVWQAARSRDDRRMDALGVERMSVTGCTTPHEVFDVYRRFTSAAYGSSLPGEDQVRLVADVGPSLPPNATWAEIGYGWGRIFPYARQFVGNSGRLLGVELSAAAKGIAGRLFEDASIAGSVELEQGSRMNCCLPESSVDIIHAAAVHLGSGSLEQFRNEGGPWFKSAARALRPEGRIYLEQVYPPLRQLVPRLSSIGLHLEQACGIPVHESPHKFKYIAVFKK